MSGLPTDITEEEFEATMKKCGLLMFDPRVRKPKLKLYKDAEGHLKGDGLCCYIKVSHLHVPLVLDVFHLFGSFYFFYLRCFSWFFFQSESVDLALQILDGYSLRGHTLSVQKAEFKMKGEFDASKKKKKLTNKEKKRMKEQQEKLAILFAFLKKQPMSWRRVFRMALDRLPGVVLHSL